MTETALILKKLNSIERMLKAERPTIFLNEREVMNKYDISRETLRKWRYAGRFDRDQVRCSPGGRKWQYSLEALDKIFNNK